MDENWRKLANIDREFLHIFWTTWGNSMQFLGKRDLKIILKFTKNQGFSLSLEDPLFQKPQGGGGRGLNWPPTLSGFSVNSVCYHMIADMNANKKLNHIFTEFLLRWRKLNISTFQLFYFRNLFSNWPKL